MNQMIGALLLIGTVVSLFVVAVAKPVLTVIEGVSNLWDSARNGWDALVGWFENAWESFKDAFGGGNTTAGGGGG